MDNEAVGQQQSLLRFQSNFVLPIARVTFLIFAACATVAVIIGIAAALYFQIKTMETPDLLDVPPKYVAEPVPVDLSDIDKYLSPPGEPQFIVTLGNVDRTLKEDDLIGHFDAATLNGLSKYPDDFSILGGESAELFQRVKRSRSQPQSALAPTAALIERIESARNSLVAGNTAMESFRLKVAARDIHGRYSNPTDISFKLSYAESSSQDLTITEPVSMPAPQQMTPLQQLAHDIAITLDPDQTKQYFDFNRRAQRIPATCGANEKTPGFMAAYRQGFEHARDQLNPAVIEAFYAGLCNSWRNMLDKQAVERREAEAARNAALQKNRDLESRATINVVAGIAGRSVSLYIIAGAFSVFLVIALSLAVLASENHSKVMRNLAEVVRSLEATANKQQKSAGAPDNEELAT